jgi:hypothetical protein
MAAAYTASVAALFFISLSSFVPCQNHMKDCGRGKKVNILSRLEEFLGSD